MDTVARIFDESLAATTDMAALPGVLGCWTLRRTVQVRLGTNPAVPRDGCPVAHPSSWSRDSNSSNIRARKGARHQSCSSCMSSEKILIIKGVRV
jgi:hypothetical protein